MRQPKLNWRRRHGWVALALAGAVMAAGVASTLGRAREPEPHVTLSAGVFGTTRTLVARLLVDAAATRGVRIELVESRGTQEEIAALESGRIDLALLPGAFPIERQVHMREVAPLYIEALHLMVKAPLARAVGENLANLRGHTVDLGPSGSTTEALATALLDFAQVATRRDAPGGAIIAHNLQLPDLEARIAAGTPEALPEAVFHLATVPSVIARSLVRGAGYRVLPLPFADAFRLGALVADSAKQDLVGTVERQHVIETVIPAFTYQMDPAVPAEPLRTLGTQLLLLAHDGVPPETIERILDAIYTTRFARMASPALDRTALALPPRLDFHDGTEDYLRRDKPYITDDTVDALSNTMSILGALVGGGLFLWQWWRQRRNAQRDELFGSYMLRVANIERRAVELELTATLELPPLAALQRELLELNTEALERFAAGELGDQSALSDLLMPINSAREHIGDLILHVRDNLEDKAEAGGRSLKAVWAEATKKAGGEDVGT